MTRRKGVKKEKDVMREHLGKLVGRTVTGLLYDPDHDLGTVWGLEFDDGKAGAFICGRRSETGRGTWRSSFRGSDRKKRHDPGATHASGV